jgi:hypothetical protein
MSAASTLSLNESLAADGIELRIAASREERAAAFRLVYQSYLRSGLGEPNQYQMRVTPYHLLPTTEIFLATCHGEPIFTMTLVIDGTLGLPMECVYADEVARRREEGLKLGEVSCLADRRRHFRGFFPVFVQLSQLMAQHAWRRGLDELLVAVHPRHARFYRQFMQFKPIGAQRAYPTVKNHPAVALALNFAEVERHRPESFDTFFGQRLPDEALEPHPITESQLAFFAEMIDPAFSFAPLGQCDLPLGSLQASGYDQQLATQGSPRTVVG